MIEVVAGALLSAGAVTALLCRTRPWTHLVLTATVVQIALATTAGAVGVPLWVQLTALAEVAAAGSLLARSWRRRRPVRGTVR